MKKVLVIILIWLATGFLTASELSYKIPQVLVIQSYHSGFLWTDNIDTGIKTTLKKFDNNIRIRTEYLDTKRVTTPEYKDKLKQMLKFKYQDSSFDVIIVADNNAFEMVKEIRDLVFKDTPIVFCGLNFFHSSQLEGLTNITGVREKIDFITNFELITKTHKNVDKILIINDLTVTGKQNKINILDDIRDFKEDVEIQIVEDISAEELKEQLRNLSPNTVVLYSLFLKDNQDRFFEYDESILFVTESAVVPVYITTDFSLGYGAVGGFLTSGTLQGENAANLAIKILQGAKADKLNIIDISPNCYYFDYQGMQKWGIKLSDLPENSIIVNYEESYFSRNKELIIKFSLILLILSGIIFLLIITLIRKNKFKNQLTKSNESLLHLKENLEVIVQERTNELEDERNFIRTVLDHEDSLVIVFDKTGMISRVNRCAVVNLEFDPDSAEGQSLWQFFDQESDIVAIKNYMKDISNSTNNLDKEVKLVSDNGKNLIIDSVISTIIVKGTKYFILTGNNVTEKHYLFEQLEKKEEKYRSVYENSGIAMITVDENNHVTMMNRKFEELIGYTKEEVLYKMKWQTFIDDSERTRMEEKKDLRYQNKLPLTDNYELKLKNKTGYVFDALINIVLVPETKEIISSITDITAKNAIQNKMKLLLQEQKAFNNAKNEFYNSFGQDLITPINSLHGIIDLVKNTKDNSDLDSYLNILRDLSCQLLYIVKEMTNFEIDRGRELVILKTNLSEFITYIAQMLIERSNITKIFYSIDDKLLGPHYVATRQLEKLIEIIIIKLVKADPSHSIFIDISSKDDECLKFTLQTGDLLSKKNKYIEVKSDKRYSFHNLEYISDVRFNYMIINELVNSLGGRIENVNNTQQDKQIVFWIKKFTKNDVSEDIDEMETENNIEKYIFPNDLTEYTMNSIANLYPLKVLIVNYNNLSHFVLFKILEILNQKIDICTPNQELIDLIEKNTYDVVFIDLSVVSINNLQTIKDIRKMNNISQPFFVVNMFTDDDRLNKEKHSEVFDLINSELPDILSIANIAFLIEAATEYKNNKE